MFCFDEVREWPRERLEYLVKLGILQVGPFAEKVTCDGCGKGHWEQVRWESSVRDTLGKRAYIQCMEEGPVHVPEIRLWQWIVDASAMAKRLAAAMDLSGTVEEVLAGMM